MLAQHGLLFNIILQVVLQQLKNTGSKLKMDAQIRVLIDGNALVTRTYKDVKDVYKEI